MSDWLPTLYSAAGGQVDDLGDLDGIDQWGALLQDLESPRQSNHSFLNLLAFRTVTLTML